MEEDRYTRITLRIPRELHAQLSTEAERTSKSLNAEIVSRLETSFAGVTPADGLDLHLRLDFMAAAIEEIREALRVTEAVTSESATPG